MRAQHVVVTVIVCEYVFDGCDAGTLTAQKTLAEPGPGSVIPVLAGFEFRLLPGSAAIGFHTVLLTPNALAELAE